MTEIPSQVVWTDRGFRWVRPSEPFPMLGCVLIHVFVALCVPALALGLLLDAEQVTLFALVGLWAAVVGWGLRYAFTAKARCSLEVDGPTIRCRTRHRLIEFDLMDVRITTDANQLVLEDDQNLLRLDGVDLGLPLLQAQDSWRPRHGDGTSGLAGGKLARIHTARAKR